MTAETLAAVKTGQYVGPIQREVNGKVVETVGDLYRGEVPEEQLAGSANVHAYIGLRRLDDREGRYERTVIALSPRNGKDGGFRGTFRKIMNALSSKNTSEPSEMTEANVGIATQAPTHAQDVQPDLVEGALRTAMAREAVEVAHLAEESLVPSTLVNEVGFEPQTTGGLIYSREVPKVRPTLAIQ